MNLIRKPNDKWTVIYLIKTETVVKKCDSIEIAADFMIDELNVAEEEIDKAICELHAYDRQMATFDNGQYSHSVKV